MAAYNNGRGTGEGKEEGKGERRKEEEVGRAANNQL